MLMVMTDEISRNDWRRCFYAFALDLTTVDLSKLYYLFRL